MLKILHAADLHLDSPFRGARLQRLGVARDQAGHHAAGHQAGQQAGHLAGHGDVYATATLEALRRMVGVALREQVDAVVLAGDLFEQKDRSVRAQLVLLAELTRLADAQIPTFIVHGNHDPLLPDAQAVSLPKLVTVFGSSWSEVPMVSRSGIPFRVQGVSYPQTAVAERLVTHFRRTSDVLTIGVLHTNVQRRPGHADYAPSTIEELRAAGLDYFALGHVHTREVITLSETSVAAYPGNLQGRNRAELGARGCLIVELDERRVRPPVVQFVPCDVVRWHSCDVSIEDASGHPLGGAGGSGGSGGSGGLDTLKARILEVVGLQTAGAEVRGHVVHVRLVGRGPLHAHLDERGLADFASDVELALAEQSPAGSALVLESLSSEAQSELDFEQLAAGGGLLGEIAAIAQGERTSAATSFESVPNIAELLEQLGKANLLAPDTSNAAVRRAARRAVELLAEEGA